jgi:RNA polymerase sigma-70 factor, ECF subfamily
MPEIDDDTLRLCQAGDETSFARLVATYEDGVYSLCSAIVGHEAEDLAQETFLRVHRHIRRFDLNGNPR